MLAQEAALEEKSKRKLRRILAFNNSFDSADAAVGNEVLHYKAPARKSGPRWRGPAKVPLMDDSGVALSFQGQTFKVARHCVRKKVRAPAEAEASCDEVFEDLCRSTPSRNEPEPPTNPPLGSLGLYKRRFPPSPDARSPALAPLGKRARLGTGESQLDFDAPTLEPHCVATDDRGPLDSFDDACTQTQGPPTTRTGYEELSHRDHHDFRAQRGYARKDSKASPFTRKHKMDEADHWRGLPQKRNRVSKDPAASGDPDVEEHRADKRFRRADAHLNFATNKETRKQHGQWWVIDGMRPAPPKTDFFCDRGSDPPIMMIIS